MEATIYIARINPKMIFHTEENTVIAVVNVVWNISIELFPIEEASQAVIVS